MAAGLGFKDFTTGEVLTAADVDGYLMQGIWVFASNAARDAAVTAPAEGNFAFTKDTNSLWYYDGAAWVASGATGDIEGVTAGVGISGGGTSGTVTVTNSMATAIDAKGDLIVGTGADTFSRLAVGGTNGHVLTVDSGETTGLKWAAAGGGGGGKVLQVVGATTSTGVNIVTSTYTDTGITATITPTLATSKILVLIAAHQGVGKNASGVNIQGRSRLMKDSTVLFTNHKTPYFEGATANDMILAGQASYVYLDSPATTSAITYKLQGMVITGAIAEYQDNSNATSTITLMEIGV